MKFALYALAVWRLSLILVQEDGPFGIATSLRERSGIVAHSATGEAISWPDWNPLHCVLCTSVWVALVLRFIPTWIQPVFAASAVVVFLERWLGHGNK